MPSIFSTADDQRKRFNEPRVNAALELDLGDSDPRRTLPHNFALLSNLHGNALSEERKQLREEIKGGTKKHQSGATISIFDLQSITKRADFQGLFEKIKPQVYKDVKNRLDSFMPGASESLPLKLDVTSMRDLGPEELAARVPQLKKKLEALAAIKRLQSLIGANPSAKKQLADLMKDAETLRAIAGR